MSARDSGSGTVARSMLGIASPVRMDENHASCSMTSRSPCNSASSRVHPADTPEEPSRWLTVIAHNLVRQRWRQAANRPALVELETDVPGAPEEEEEFDSALAYDVRRGLEEAVQALAEDVHRSIEYHHSQPGTSEVSQAFVSGEGALIPGLDVYLRELLGVSTHRANPVAKLGSNESNISDEQLSAMEPVLAVALGLAMEDE